MWTTLSSLTQPRYHEKYKDPSHRDKRDVATFEPISRQSLSVHFYDWVPIAWLGCVLTSWKHLCDYMSTINERYQADELTSKKTAASPVRCGVAPRDPRNNSNVNGGGHVVMADKNRARVGAIARTYIKGPRRANTSGNGGWQNLRSPSVPRRSQTSPVSNSPIVDRVLSHCGRLQPASSQALDFRGPPRPVIDPKGAGSIPQAIPSRSVFCVAYARFCRFAIPATSKCEPKSLAYMTDIS